MFAMSGARRDYVWGSRIAIPTFLGEEAGEEAVAELWFGAHPSAPSPILGSDGTLADLIASDPEAMLGERVIAEFGAELPFLFKLIAPAAPLSMQVHPSRDQARDGLARAAHGSYVDENHKPELLLPFIDFEVLAGLRTANDALRMLEGLKHPLTAEVAALITADGVGAAFAHVLTHADGAAVEQIAAQCAARASGDEHVARADEIAAHLHTAHPGDRGVVASLLLEARTLTAGEAMFVPAGTVHAYLSGLGAEIMANSDNVLRAGLTPKHVDVEELLRVLEPGSRPRIFCAPLSEQEVTRYHTPIRDFELTLLTADTSPVPAASHGPRIIMALDDGVQVTAERPHPNGVGHLALARGGAAFVAHCEGAITVSGGRALHAAVGDLA